MEFLLGLLLGLLLKGSNNTNKINAGTRHCKTTTINPVKKETLKIGENPSPKSSR